MNRRRGALVAFVATLAVSVVGPRAGAQGAGPGVRSGSAPTAAVPTRADSAVLRLLERASAAYQGARTLRAEFTQRLSNPRTRTEFESVGEFFQRGADRFAFKFSKPPEDRIVSDGQVVWLYSPSTARGQVYKLPRGAGAGMDLASSVLKDPARRYTVTAGADSMIDGRTVRAVVLVPKAQGVAFLRAVLWLDTQNALVRRAEFAEATGATRTLEFRNIRTGASLPRDAFVFVPPAGVRVIDPAAALGGTSRP